MAVYSKALQKKSFNSAGGVLEADLQLIELGAWMKIRGYDNALPALFIVLRNIYA